MQTELSVILLSKDGKDYNCPCLTEYKEKTIKELEADGYEYKTDCPIVRPE